MTNPGGYGSVCYRGTPALRPHVRAFQNTASVPWLAARYRSCNARLSLSSRSLTVVSDPWGASLSEQPSRPDPRKFCSRLIANFEGASRRLFQAGTIISDATHVSLLGRASREHTYLSCSVCKNFLTRAFSSRCSVLGVNWSKLCRAIGLILSVWSERPVLLGSKRGYLLALSRMLSFIFRLNQACRSCLRDTDQCGVNQFCGRPKLFTIPTVLPAGTLPLRVFGCLSRVWECGCPSMLINVT